MKNYYINWLVFILGLLFFIEQNTFFGWNGQAQSKEELIVDGVNILIFALAFIRKQVTEVHISVEKEIGNIL